MPTEEIGFVYFENQFAGMLRKDDGAFVFEYDNIYRLNSNNISLSLSLPLSQKTHFFERLHPFFEGLLAEGWMKKIQERTQKIGERDSFSRLLSNGADLIGAVRIYKEKL